MAKKQAARSKQTIPEVQSEQQAVNTLVGTQPAAPNKEGLTSFRYDGNASLLFQVKFVELNEGVVDVSKVECLRNGKSYPMEEVLRIMGPVRMKRRIQKHFVSGLKMLKRTDCLTFSCLGPQESVS